MMILGVVGFMARHGCQKCTVVGQYSRKYKRMSFPAIDANRRTDHSFRLRHDALHHKESSPLEKLNIDMIYSIPSSDPLHLLDLGVMRRCMFRWVYGAKGYIRKWSKARIERASRLLENCQKFMPREIHRAVRNLNDLRKWKGVEFRTILIYVGFVVLKEILPDNEYEHFLRLACAARICYSKSLKHFHSVANKCFIQYIQQYINIYGRHMIGSNVHLLSHIVEDLHQNRRDNLMDMSTYRFENSLRLIGLELKSGNRPLEQVSRRIIERSQLQKPIDFRKTFESKEYQQEMFYEKKRESVVTYDKIQFSPDFALSNRKFADSWFLTKFGEIVKMLHVIKIGNEYKIVGSVIKQKNAFFPDPVNSIKLKIFCSDGILCNGTRIFGIESIVAKMICLPCDEKFVLIPMLHTMDSLLYK